MASLTLPSELVSVDWLNQSIEHPDLIVLDASFFMPGVERDGRLEWLDIRIPGAVFFDFHRDICLHSTSLPHMMPSSGDFQKSAQKLGINQNSVIVVYDSLGIFSSPRVWWMLKAMGAKQVAVLDGGLPAWIDKSFALESGAQSKSISVGNFIADYQDKMFCDVQQVLKNTQTNERIIIDARSADRFSAKVPEPREGMRSGHMPNAKNLPFASILSNKKMREAYQLSVVFDAIAPKEHGVIFSCGSGVTACILALGATLAGYKDICVYDGSWAEWGGSVDLPIVS